MNLLEKMGVSLAGLFKLIYVCTPRIFHNGTYNSSGRSGHLLPVFKEPVLVFSIHPSHLGRFYFLR
ncbi:MAG: hypothetical protein C0407_01175 [Desulfobacca sp.]|nr:hypothetical protein [Desulfobacca sp.]